jgi:hypothetical protein
VILYTFTFYFTMHQSSHLVYMEADQRVKLNSCLAFLMRVEQIIIVVFLVWYGYRTVWYYPLSSLSSGQPRTRDVAIAPAVRRPLARCSAVGSLTRN